MTKQTRNSSPSTQKQPDSAKTTTKSVVARVQGAVARKNNGQVPKGAYVGRMQRAAKKK